jgi:hypothetical protein
VSTALRSEDPAPAVIGTHTASHRMKKTLSALVLACSATLALAHGCPKEMAAIDARMATSPKLSDADKAKVQKLRADGETAHKAGKHDDSMKLLAEAKKILGI